MPQSSVQVVFVGDTHGDMAALEAAAAFASESGSRWVVSVGDLWWQPRAAYHAEISRALARITDTHRVSLLLVDGNNDDAESLSASCDTPVRVADRFWYAPRGSSWVWQGRRFVGLGGAVTYRREGRVLGVDLFTGEQLSAEDVARACAVGSADVVVCHDAPEGAPIPVELAPGPDAAHRALVAHVVEQLNPALVVHGHYHKAYDHIPDSGARIVGMGRDRAGSADVCRVDLRTLHVLEHVRTGGAEQL